jgi:FkbM family methyltransferase
MISRLWQKARSVLDRPGRRWLLAPPASVWVSTKERSPCLVYWRDGTWVHHYRSARIPHAGLGRAAPPHIFTAGVRDPFLYDYTPGSGDVVFDVGAGTGAETLVFSRLVGPAGRVVSIEAHPRTFERLERLRKLNRLTNVTPLQVAVSDVEGEVVISDLGDHLRNIVLAESDEGIVVAARRIDAIAAEVGISRIDLLKMNVEGAECAALQGLGALITNIRHVCISCHDFLADDGGADELRTKSFVHEFLLEHGFRVFSREDAAEPWTRDYVYGTRNE